MLKEYILRDEHVTKQWDSLNFVLQLRFMVTHIQRGKMTESSTYTLHILYEFVLIQLNWAK